MYCIVELGTVWNLFLLGRGELFHTFIRLTEERLRNPPTITTQTDINEVRKIVSLILLESITSYLTNFSGLRLKYNSIDVRMYVFRGTLIKYVGFFLGVQCEFPILTLFLISHKYVDNIFYKILGFSFRFLIKHF